MLLIFYDRSSYMLTKDDRQEVACITNFYWLFILPVLSFHMLLQDGRTVKWKRESGVKKNTFYIEISNGKEKDLLLCEDPPATFMLDSIWPLYLNFICRPRYIFLTNVFLLFFNQATLNRRKEERGKKFTTLILRCYTRGRAKGEEPIGLVVEFEKERTISQLI